MAPTIFHLKQESAMSIEQPVTAPIPTTFRGPGIRMMFLGFFGTWWTIAGCQGLYGAGIPVMTAAAIVGLSIFFVGLYLSSTSVQRPQEEQPEALQRARTFRNINIVQWAAIAALIITLNVLGHGEWLFPGIMSIVGLHFLPLASWVLKIESKPLVLRVRRAGYSAGLRSSDRSQWTKPTVLFAAGKRTWYILLR
jgi:hypothetical protein